MPRWIKDIYFWRVKLGWKIDNLAVFRFCGPNGAPKFRINPYKVYLDNGKTMWFDPPHSHLFECTLKEFINRKISYRNGNNANTNNI